MKPFAYALIAVLIAASGCARLSSNGSGGSPNYSPQADCERQGGVWNAVTGNCIPSKAK